VTCLEIELYFTRAFCRILSTSRRKRLAPDDSPYPLDYVNTNLSIILQRENAVTHVAFHFSTQVDILAQIGSGFQKEFMRYKGLFAKMKREK
jgi:hypothetical protein